MKFTKMHGIGNDYVYVDCFKEHVDDPAKVSRAISDRHKGIGSDGLILIEPSKVADVRMRMFNADGSESEMCGNGVRCVAKYAFDHGLSKANPIRVETGRGVLNIAMKVVEGKVREATVDMGAPILESEKIPVDPSKISDEVRGATFVSMGNPHAVMFVDDVASLDLNLIGPRVERHPAFPKRINAHWVQVHSRDEITMRTWERGSGITQACGTGAAAVCVAGVLTNRTNRKILAHLPGGDLTLEWRESDDHVYKTGPAVEVFSGEWFPNS
ncbi:MAG: diaminopimelate epimerase [Anaerolineae bacterium]|nr:diaminopimelate epimerase [Phycisphaerae bacterium]